jgi:hypothetical protein
MKKVEMSSDAILRRLKQTEQLRQLSLSLMKAKVLTDDEAKKLREDFRKRNAANKSQERSGDDKQQEAVQFREKKKNQSVRIARD